MSNIQDIMNNDYKMQRIPMEYRGLTNVLLPALDVLVDELERIASNLEKIEKQLRKVHD